MNSSRLRIRSLLVVSDILLTILSLLLATYLRTTLPYGKPLGEGGEILPWPVYLIAIMCWIGSLSLVGAYDARQTDRPWLIASRVFLGGVLATILFAGVLYLSYREISRLQFIYFFSVNLLFLLTARFMVFGFIRPEKGNRWFTPTNVLIIGAGDLAQDVAQQVRANSLWGYQVVGFLDDDFAEMKGDLPTTIPLLGTLSDLLPIIEQKKIGEVWSTLPPQAYDQLHQLVSQLERFPVRIKVIPDYFSLALIKAEVEMLGGFPIIGLREPMIRGMRRITKRIFDIIISIPLLLLTLPVMAVIGLAIFIEDRGSLLFSQTRVGENGALFQMFKFRSMTPGSEAQVPHPGDNLESGDLIHKIPDDPRVTHVGRFLRRYSLDELPQLVNVLKGDMSLVGPRPELPWLVDRYKPWQRKRFAVPQGITGWWQINGRSDKPMHLNTDEDLYYIYNYSIWLDLLILLRTPFAVLQGRGAF